MSLYSGVYNLCSNPTLTNVISKAKACRYQGNQDSYAVMETYLDYVSLPFARETSFMGSGFGKASYDIRDDVVCIVLAVCNSLRNIGLFIYMVDERFGGE